MKEGDAETIAAYLADKAVFETQLQAHFESLNGATVDLGRVFRSAELVQGEADRLLDLVRDTTHGFEKLIPLKDKIVHQREQIRKIATSSENVDG